MEEAKLIENIDAELEKMASYNYDEAEPEFKSLSPEKPILIVWRIEKLKLHKFPEADVGRFYEGDSFLVLKIKSKEEMNVHVWIGKSSSPDEIAFASYKAMQLDKVLNNECNIFYESHGKESKLFLSYFKYFQVLEGGIDADLSSFRAKQYQHRLFHVHSEGGSVYSRQIPIKKKNINSGDVYLLDIGLKIYAWRGKTSNSFEKFNLTCMAQKIKDYRSNKIQIISIDEGSNNSMDVQGSQEFNELIEKFEENIDEKVEDESYKKFRKMMKLSDENGKMELTEVNYDKANLISNDAFIIDRGDAIITWIGKGASKNEKRYARFYTNRYIVKEKRNFDLPLFVINEGKLSEELDKCFK